MTDMTPTTSADALERLAVKVESLSWPDREVDCLIKEAVGDSWDYAADWGLRGQDRPRAFPYTASVDVATSLFSPDTMYRSGHSALAPDPSMFFCDAVLADGSDVHSLAMTEANARTAAALRSRAKEASNG